MYSFYLSNNAKSSLRKEMFMWPNVFTVYVRRKIGKFGILQYSVLLGKVCAHPWMYKAVGRNTRIHKINKGYHTSDDEHLEVVFCLVWFLRGSFLYWNKQFCHKWSLKQTGHSDQLKNEYQAEQTCSPQYLLTHNQQRFFTGKVWGTLP